MRSEVVVQRSIVAALLQIEIGLGGVRDAGSDPEEVVLSPPEIIEPDVRMSVLVENPGNVSFALKSPVKIWRSQGGCAKFNEANQIGRRKLDSQPDDGA